MNRDATVHLVDDEPEFLRSLGHLLRTAGFAVKLYDSPLRFLDDHDPAATGCAVLDFAMEEMDGLALQTELLRRGGARPIVFLSGRAAVPNAVQAMKAGAVDFLIKPVDGDELIQAVKRALKKDRADRLEASRRAIIHQHLDSLTERERAVLPLVTDGLLNKEIADRLGITERTVKFHRGHLMAKLGMHSVVELTHLLHSLGDGNEHP